MASSVTDYPTKSYSHVTYDCMTGLEPVTDWKDIYQPALPTELHAMLSSIFLASTFSATTAQNYPSDDWLAPRRDTDESMLRYITRYSASKATPEVGGDAISLFPLRGTNHQHLTYHTLPIFQLTFPQVFYLPLLLSLTTSPSPFPTIHSPTKKEVRG